MAFGSLRAGVSDNCKLPEITRGTDPGSSDLNHWAVPPPPLSPLLPCIVSLAAMVGERELKMQESIVMPSRRVATQQLPFTILYWTGSPCVAWA